MAAAQSSGVLLQTETMTLVAPMSAGHDIAAMGGRFISATSGTSTTSPVRSAHVQVSVPAAGTYYLWARIAGQTIATDRLYVGIDSSFARVLPSTLGPYQWVRVETADGSGVHGFSLGAGDHTIQVGYGEIGAKLDAVYLTADAAEVPSFTPPQHLLIEAEALNRVAPMTVGSETAAMGGQYLSPTSGTNTNNPVRSADVQVSMPAGTWYLWARIAGPTSTSDALYVGIDASFDRIFPSASGPYQWVRVETTDGSAAHGFSLGAGTHAIQVGHGEIGAKLDAVYLTNDAAEVPTIAPMRRVIEAESLNLTPPMTVGTDAAANGAQYISPTSGTNTTVPVREAWTTVTAPSAGTYYLWARLMGPGFDSDRLYIGFDNAWNRVVPPSTGAYHWVRVEAVPGSGEGVTLSAGVHDIQVGHGEIGARLDAVYVTDDPEDSPAGSTASGFPAACALPSGGYKGFGRNTLLDPNLPARAVYRVNSLADPGVAGTLGTLRDALSQPNRCVVFDMGGQIDMTNKPSLNVKSNVIIDGFTAPSAGITLVNNKPTGSDEGAEPPILNISNGVSNVVVRGIRIRNAPGDAIRIVSNASNVVVDRVSVTSFGDGAVDVTNGAHHVTIQWSILGEGKPGHNFVSLLANDGTRISVHHNLFINGQDRQPKCGGKTTTTQADFLVCDVRNNVIWNYTGAGTAVRHAGTGNVVNNYYKEGPGGDNAIWVADGGVAYTAGNVSHDGSNPNNGNRSSQFPIDAADVPATTSARDAALAVKAGAGARGHNFGLDSKDQAFIDGISIPLP